MIKEHIVLFFFSKQNTPHQLVKRLLNQFADRFSYYAHERGKKYIRNIKEATGIEPVTSRSAVECSTTELYPLAYNKAVKFLFLTRES